MLQKVTFVAQMFIDTGQMSVREAKRNVRQALTTGDQDQDYGLRLNRLLKLEVMEEGA